MMWSLFFRGMYCKETIFPVGIQMKINDKIHNNIHSNDNDNNDHDDNANIDNDNYWYWNDNNKW